MEGLRGAIDLRSDTVTLPTAEMREAMYRAEVGDDGRGEDPTVNRLQDLAAQMLGKEAALFVASGTMGNLVSLKAQAKAGDAIILEAASHIFCNEAPHLVGVSGLLPRPVPGHYGVLSPEDVRAAVGSAPVAHSSLSMIAIENTHNRASGNAWTPDQTQAIRDVADELRLAVHLDGARLFNAAVALGVDVRELTRPVDTVTICLSKGLSAPMGSVVAGSADFIERARQARKMVGGEMRQVGFAAAAGVVALTTMVERLSEDHARAARLRKGLSAIEGLRVETPPIPTNLVFFDVAGLGTTAADFVKSLRARGVLAVAFSATSIRLATHRHISAQDVEVALRAIEETAREAKA